MMMSFLLIIIGLLGGMFFVRCGNELVGHPFAEWMYWIAVAWMFAMVAFASKAFFT